jgi:hypothetical protein
MAPLFVVDLVEAALPRGEVPLPVGVGFASVSLIDDKVALVVLLLGARLFLIVSEMSQELYTNERPEIYVAQ